MLFLLLSLYGTVKVSSQTCLNEIVKAYDAATDAEKTQIETALGNEPVFASFGDPATCNDTHFDDQQAICTQDITAMLDGIVDPTTQQCDGSNGKIYGDTFCNSCVALTLPCTDAAVCDKPCRAHSDCDSTSQMLYCASIADRVDNNNYPHLDAWNSTQLADHPYNDTLELENDPGRCRPSAECFYFHDSIMSCTTANCEPGDIGEFGVDHHRVCPNIINKINPCTSNADCQDNAKVKGGKGFCPTTGQWKVCYEDFLCCAYKEGKTDYGNIVVDEFGGTCQQDCSTAYKCQPGEAWDLANNRCVTPTSRRFLGIAKSEPGDSTQENLDKAKVDGMLATATATTAAPGNGAGAMFTAAVFYVLALLF